MKFEHNTSIGVAMKRSEKGKILPQGIVFSKNAKIYRNFNELRLQAAITPQRLQIDGNSLPK